MAEIDIPSCDQTKSIEQESSIMESTDIVTQHLPSAATHQILETQVLNVEANWIKRLVITSIFIFVSLIITFSIFIFSQNKRPLQLKIPLITQNSTQISTENKRYFTQRIDHFNHLDQRTFQHKYFINTTFYRQNGAVILYPCGQSICRQSASLFTMKLAQSLKAALIQPQHRYFGDSLPFGNQSLTLQNLKYLTCEHVLADITAIIEDLPNILMKELSNRTDIRNIQNPPILLMGTSYTGSLAAWHRSKYPHLSAGAFISSGVVQAIDDYWQYDEQIGNDASMSEGCRQKTLQLTAFAQSRMGTQLGKQFKQTFASEMLTDIQFLMLWSRAASMFIQYSMRSQFCEALIKEGIVDMIKRLKQFQEEDYELLGPQIFGSYYLSDPEKAATTNQYTINARSFAYLKCTQLGYFQVASKNGISSQKITLQVYKNWCKSIFGNEIRLISQQPKMQYFHQTERVNLYFGGKSMKATNIILTNFNEDPWRWANIQQKPKDADQSFQVQLIKCTDCGHCVEMNQYKEQNRAIHRIHIKILELAKKWIKEDKSKKN